MKHFRLAVLHLLSIPADLLAAVAVTVLWVLSGFRLRHGGFDQGAWWILVPGDSWLEALYGTVTFGHIVVVHPTHHEFGHCNAAVAKHELVHVEQFESHCIGGLMVVLGTWLCGLIYNPILVAPFVPVLMYTGAGITAMLRGEGYYDGNVWEEAARGH